MTVALYNRANRNKMVERVFTPADPGELIGGYRFHDVGPVILPKVRAGAYHLARYLLALY